MPELSDRDKPMDRPGVLCVGCEGGPAKHGEGYCDSCWFPEGHLEKEALRAEVARLRAEATEVGKSADVPTKRGSELQRGEETQ